MKTQRSSGIAVPFHALGSRWGLVVNTMPQPLYPREDLVLFVHKSGWASGSIWMGTKKISTQPTFEPQTNQPVASCYTDCAVLAVIVVM
jgi:hypothetical protein